MKRRSTPFLFACFLLLSSANAAAEQGKECFASSLHATGEGMRYWYEEAGGFMGVTGIPYSELDCGNCHISSCDTCHAETNEEEGSCSYSTAQARKTETCLKCHGREGLTYKMCRAKDKLDVHAAREMSCSECHGVEDVHGDGKRYQSMRAPGAVKAKCTNCTDEALPSSRERSWSSAGTPRTVSLPMRMKAFCSTPPRVASTRARRSGSSISNMTVATSSLPWGINGL